ncbi:outer membrane efflux protein [Crinalium epipsammum PCC 9333]|uniref:Outer membrane efflux protein n=2 Tax=Crinalium TaxID=241421 RepID=K9VZH9_9CYAN|nr:outer membrane efflux protein [Crinalium epipsammum PCC 9333]
MSKLNHSLNALGTSFLAFGVGAISTLSNTKLGIAQIPSQIMPSENLSDSNQLLIQNGSSRELRVAQANTPSRSQPPRIPSGINQPLIQNGSISVPDFLNPNPNRLQLPTKPEEVRINQVQPITLQQAIELARRNNRTLQTTVLTLERSQAAVREALAARSPTVGVQGDLTRSNSANSELSRRQQPEQLRSENTASNTFNSTLQLNYDLLNSGRRTARIRAAEEQVRFNQLDVQRQSEQVSLDVSNAYYDLQQADEQVNIAEASVRDTQRSLRDAQLLERAGLGTQFDVLRAQVELANANQELVRARNQQSLARRQLVQILSLSPTVEVTAADPIAVAGSWNLSLEQSIVLALKNRAELEQQLARRNISQQQERIALADIRPQVNLFANYNILDVLTDNVGFADGYNLGARVTWNFLDGGAARARAQQERINQAIAETSFADVSNQVRLQVEQGFFNLNSSRENIQTASVALEQATKSLELARLRFNAGVGTQTDVITAQTELTRARGNRLRAIIDYNRGLASLQRAISNFSTNTLSITR